jgi:hypothetical protein
MISEQFIEACAQALHREHGNRAREVAAAQVTTLQTYNPHAAGNWQRIAEHLRHQV